MYVSDLGVCKIFAKSTKQFCNSLFETSCKNAKLHKLTTSKRTIECTKLKLIAKFAQIVFLQKGTHMKVIWLDDIFVLSGVGKVVIWQKPIAV